MARRTFQANLKQAEYEYLNVAMRPENVTREGRNYGFRVGASAEIPTTLSKVLGFQDVGVSVLAEAIGVLTTPTEVVMALDTTYSMTGWKINTLKDAATRLVDDLRPLAHDGEKLRFGIVPFAQYVNIVFPTEQAVDERSGELDRDGQYCNDERPVISQTNCRTEYVPPSPPGTCYNDGVPYSCAAPRWQPHGLRQCLWPGSESVRLLPDPPQVEWLRRLAQLPASHAG